MCSWLCVGVVCAAGNKCCGLGVLFIPRETTRTWRRCRSIHLWEEARHSKSEQIRVKARVEICRGHPRAWLCSCYLQPSQEGNSACITPRSWSERINRILEHCESFVAVVDFNHCSINLLSLGQNFCAISLYLLLKRKILKLQVINSVLGTCCRMEFSSLVFEVS